PPPGGAPSRPAWRAPSAGPRTGNTPAVGSRPTLSGLNRGNLVRQEHINGHLLAVGPEGNLVLAGPGDGDGQVPQGQQPDLQRVGRLERLVQLLPPQHVPLQGAQLHLDGAGAVGVAPAGEDRQVFHHGVTRAEDLVDRRNQGVTGYTESTAVHKNEVGEGVTTEEPT